MEQVDVVVVGGGLAGWAAAATAAGPGTRVRLLDPSGAGGRAATDEQEGFFLNRGAHALYEHGAGAAVLTRLGVDAPGGRPPLAGGLGRVGDEIGLLPSSPGSIVRTSLLSLRQRGQVARLFSSAGRWKPERLGELSTNEWFDSLGLGGRVREVAAAYIRLATYAADHDRLSADVAAGQLQMSLRGVRYVDGGWRRIIGGLRSTAERRGATSESVRVRTIVPVAGGVEVLTDDGAIRAAEVVVAAGSPEACARLLPEAPPSWRDLGPPAFAACLDVGLDHVPEPGLLLGIDLPLYASRHTPAARLAPPGSSVVHAMRYLRADERLDPASGRAELDDHLEVMGIAVGQATVARYLHRMTTVSALPDPRSGGLVGRPRVDSADLDHVLVAGDWVGPTGHLADASLASGEAAGALASRHADRPTAVR